MAKYRILSFDGGGLKGLLSLGIMERLSAELGGDAWIRQADLYAGTSTGGLIALCLASGKPVAEISDFYRNEGPAIFNRKTWTYLTSLCKLLHVGYENRALDKALLGLFGDRRLHELDKKVLAVSFDLHQRQGKRAFWAPKVFHNFPGQGQDADLARHVGLYTSAAPTFLPSVAGYVDGGVCANNPSMCALAQVLDERIDERQEQDAIHLLSIGTGVNPESVNKKTVRWGALGWNLKILRVIMDGSVGIADYQCRQILGKERYQRLQPILDERIDMDDAKKIPELIRLGETMDSKTIRQWADWISRNWMA